MTTLVFNDDPRLHELPHVDSDIMPCCGRSQWEPPLERLTSVKDRVNCPGPDGYPE